jgi:transcriptional regulator with XRE-family HTH domain
MAASNALAELAAFLPRPEPNGAGPPGANGNDLRRRELGAFIRSRRERIRPEQVGFYPTRRRRTPGLRREEVAQLSNVGITWYTWLEQGRDINPSPQVLDAIARTLQFDAHEHAHLFTLAGHSSTTIANECYALCPTLQPLIDQLEPFPAMIVSARFDLLAYNRPYASFFDNLDSMPIEDRNILWLSFTDPRWREVIVDREEVLSRMVAEYRAAMAEHLDDPAWKTLVARLQHASPEFRALWERHDVLGVESRTKRAMHPTVGLLRVTYTNLWLGPQPGGRIVAFTPADDRTRKQLEALALETSVGSRNGRSNGQRQRRDRDDSPDHVPA